jgi:hypothetical protein
MVHVPVPNDIVIKMLAEHSIVVLGGIGFLQLPQIRVVQRLTETYNTATTR